MQVQRDQHDAQQFWLALLDAVRHATGADSGAELPAATPGFNEPAMVDRVLSELADAHGGVTLVIDDLHELHSPEDPTQLTRLLTSLPPSVQAILTTRHDVRLRLHQLRLAGELAEIRAADLRFSERETRELLEASGIALSAAGAAQLHQRTEGWAAGLRLAVLSLAGHPDPERFVAEFSGSDRTVAEYLLAEMLDRQHRLQVAIASLQLSLARRGGHLAGVIEQAQFLAAPVTGQSEDIALGSDLRAMALMNLGTAEAWTLGTLAAPDAERHLQEGADLAREIGRPYLEVGCLAQLGFASLVLHSFATTERRCRDAIALGERHGWGVEPVIAPALIMLAGTLAWTGEFEEGERWLQRTRQALQTDSGPDITLLLHQTAGILHAGRDGQHEALEEFGAAEDLGSQLADSQALATRTTRWLLATQARLGMTGEARALLAALDDERASSGEFRIVLAVICLAEGNPAAALAAVADVLDGTAPVLGSVTVMEAHLLAGLAHRELGDQGAANQAAERALALAEPDRLILPFAMTSSAELLEALPRHQTAHAALLADILDVLHGSSPAAAEQSSLPAAELSPGELRVLRYLPTNLSRPEIAGELSVSLNTVSTHLRSIYAKLQVRDRSSAVQHARELRLLAANRTR